MVTDTPKSEAPKVPATPAGPELSAAAHDEWRRHVEAILRGIAHALNNRAAALSAVMQLAGDDEQPTVVNSVLATELQRVTDLAAAVRTISTPRGGEMAFSPSDAAAEASDVLKLHADQRDRTTPIDARAGSPVRAQRWMFVRALLVLAAGTDPDNARIVIVDDGDHVAVRVEGAPAATSRYVEEIARAMGGEASDGGRSFRVPTLAALRRREES